MLRTRRRCASILLTALLAVAPRAGAQTLAITGATIIDGTGSAPLSDGVIVITAGRIAAIGGSADIAIPQAATRLDARGKYVIPGLMDANLHLFNYGLETLIRYEDRYHEIVLEAAQITLKTGQTTVFDTWGPRAALVKARDRINAGEAAGSRIYLAGNIIGFDGPLSKDFYETWAAHVSKAFAKRTNETWQQGTGRELMWMTPEQVRAVIRTYASKDVDFLKYGATGHASPGMISPTPDFITFSPRVQKTIVEEAHRAGITVQAHTTSVESLAMAIEAGVGIVTHGDLTGPTTSIPEETIRKLVERKISVSVRPATQRHVETREKLDPKSIFTPYIRTERTNQRNMIGAGVTMLVSTDASIEDPVLAESRASSAETADPRFKLGEGHFNVLVALEELGMDRMEILKSATSNVARAYKLDANIGTLERGKIADLVILDGNPLESARNYRRIRAVIKDGRIVDLNALPVAPIITAKAKTN